MIYMHQSELLGFLLGCSFALYEETPIVALL
jgi:hypothetical protein